MKNISFQLWNGIIVVVAVILIFSSLLSLFESFLNQNWQLFIGSWFIIFAVSYGLYSRFLKRKNRKQNSKIVEESITGESKNKVAIKNVFNEKPETLLVFRFVKKNYFKLSLITLIIIIVGGYFYWFQIRPFFAYRSCHEIAGDKAQDWYKEKYPHLTKNIKKGVYEKKDYEFYYKQCLRKKGLNK